MKFTDAIIAKFEQRKPFSVMSRILLAHTLSATRLDKIFADHCESQVPSETLKFSTVAEILGDVVSRIHPSVNAAYVDREMGVSVNSVYNKLNGVETQVSRAIVRETANGMRDIIRELDGMAKPLLQGYRVKVFDGNHLRRTDSRIGVLRDENVAPLPGKSLVIYDPEYRLAIDVIPCECGHASERSLFPSLLETVERDDAVVADRNFCTIAFLAGIAERRARFVIRQHGQMPYELKGKRRWVAEIETGQVYEQTMHIVDAKGNVLIFRRITVHLFEPTRDGDVEIQIITNLPKSAAKAAKIARLYRKRWTIETAFQKMAENLEGEIQSLGYPKAALFGFCLALTSFNVYSTMNATVQASHGEDAADELSIYYVSNEIKSAREGMDVAIDKGYWLDRYSHKTHKQVAVDLKRIAKSIHLKKYKKNKWTPKTKKKKQDKTNRQHASTCKLLKAAREAG